MKKAIKTVLIILAVLMAVGAAVIIYGVTDYMNRVPVITPYENITVNTGETLTIDRLAKVEKAVQMSIYQTSEGLPGDAAIAPDNLSIYVGEEPCTIKVYVSATGSNSESREEAVVITVTDSPMA
ncbi:MAG: hypothetical protein IKP75_00400 [Oscillospiraceae bacterium]|nr:hypothetical protein [Oscillospiraceae bacterium]